MELSIPRHFGRQNHLCDPACPAVSPVVLGGASRDSTAFGAMEDCREPARDIPLVTNVMRKESRHTQRRDRASGVPLDILEHLPPQKTESAYFIALCSHL